MIVQLTHIFMCVTLEHASFVLLLLLYYTTSYRYANVWDPYKYLHALQLIHIFISYATQARFHHLMQLIHISICVRPRHISLRLCLSSKTQAHRDCICAIHVLNPIVCNLNTHAVPMFAPTSLAILYENPPHVLCNPSTLSIFVKKRDTYPYACATQAHTHIGTTAVTMHMLPNSNTIDTCAPRAPLHIVCN
jgi:hypothetical protein